MTFRSTKTWGHSVGLSSCFRQWRASNSHCRFLHGYAFEISLTFEAKELDDRNWVVDFGSFKDLKGWLQDVFDHKTLVAEDDPQIDWFREGHARGLLDIFVVPATGCERFAQMIYWAADSWMQGHDLSDRCKLISVEVREHDGNSALYLP